MITQIRKYGEITFVRTFYGRCFKLKLLLALDHCKGLNPEEELRKFQGTIHKTCKDTCILLVILQNEQE